MLGSLHFMQGVPEITSSQHGLSISTMWILFILERKWRKLSRAFTARTRVAERTLKSHFKEPDSFRRSCAIIFNTKLKVEKTGLVQKTLAWQQDCHRQTQRAQAHPPKTPSLPHTRIIKPTYPSTSVKAKWPWRSPLVHGQAGWRSPLRSSWWDPTLTFQPSADNDIRYFPYETQLSGTQAVSYPRVFPSLAVAQMGAQKMLAILEQRG